MACAGYTTGTVEKTTGVASLGKYQRKREDWTVGMWI